MILTHVVTQADNGKRAVDVWCARTGMSRLLAKKIRLYGVYLLNGQSARMIDPVYTGQEMVAVWGAEPRHMRLNEVEGVSTLFADDWVAVVSKPHAMVTHPRHRDDSEGLTTRLCASALHPVNRLDRDTSGLVILAMNGHAHHVLVKKGYTKEYTGLVHGVFSPPSGRIDAPIARASDSIIERVVDPIHGRASATQYETIRVVGQKKYSLVRFRLETGRTHQIRVHCRFAGHALVGDSLYPQHNGTNGKWAPTKLDRSMGRQALHASRTGFYHPVHGYWLDFISGLPADIQFTLRLAEVVDGDEKV